MKLILCALLCAICVSCIHYKGADGTSLTMLGTNAETVSAGGLSMSTVNQSDSIKHGADTIRDVTRLKGWFGIGNTAVGELGNAADQLIK